MLFRDFLEQMESSGWTLVRIWPPYRVFMKPGQLPIMARVENKENSDDDATRIFEIVEKAAAEEPDEGD